MGGGGGVGELGGGVVGVQVGVLVGEGGANIWKVRSCQKISCLH